VISYFL